MMKPAIGERKYADFAIRLTSRVGPVSSAAVHDVAGFKVIYNPTDSLTKIDGVRLRPRSGVVKTTGGRMVASFDETGGMTYDSGLAGPLLDEFDIPRGE